MIQCVCRCARTSVCVCISLSVSLYVLVCVCVCSHWQYSCRDIGSVCHQTIYTHCSLSYFSVSLFRSLFPFLLQSLSKYHSLSFSYFSLILYFPSLALSSTSILHTHRGHQKEVFETDNQVSEISTSVAMSLFLSANTFFEDLV